VYISIGVAMGAEGFERQQPEFTAKVPTALGGWVFQIEFLREAGHGDHRTLNKRSTILSECRGRSGVFEIGTFLREHADTSSDSDRLRLSLGVLPDKGEERRARKALTQAERGTMPLAGRHFPKCREA